MPINAVRLAFVPDKLGLAPADGAAKHLDAPSIPVRLVFRRVDSIEIILVFDDAPVRCYRPFVRSVVLLERVEELGRAASEG